MMKDGHIRLFPSSLMHEVTGHTQAYTCVYWTHLNADETKKENSTNRIMEREKKKEWV